MAITATEFSIDPYSPAEMAQKAQTIGVTKAKLDTWSTLTLAVMAGAFIALGAVFSTLVSTDTGTGYGITRLIAGVSFSLGLILVVIAGAELFTGNNMILIAWMSGKVSLGQLIRNWSIVYVGNFVAAALTAVFIFYTGQYVFDGFRVGANALAIANSKVNLTWLQAFTRGVMCNALVCLAVWLCYSARSNTDKVLAIIPPITAFVAMGFEHSIANMYFIPYGIFMSGVPEVVQASGKTMADLANLTWHNFVFSNLIPVTLGNIVGGTMMVAGVYWFVYMRKQERAEIPAMFSLSLAEPPRRRVEVPTEEQSPSC